MDPDTPPTVGLVTWKASEDPGNSLSLSRGADPPAPHWSLLWAGHVDCQYVTGPDVKEFTAPHVNAGGSRKPIFNMQTAEARLSGEHVYSWLELHVYRDGQLAGPPGQNRNQRRGPIAGTQVSVVAAR